MPDSSVDFILTDPPYLIDYRKYAGCRVKNDDNDRWLRPAFAEMFRLMKDGSFCVSFYASSQVDRFMAAWREAGFHTAGHIVFRKDYSASARFVRYQHETAFLLTKGKAVPPADPIGDVIDWTHTGNRLHPTQKPVGILTPLIQSFCKPDGIVLDPFCGSGSTLVAANELGRRCIGMELVAKHYETARKRLRL
jgi:adenine-specific DNA-methyltransferase